MSIEPNPRDVLTEARDLAERGDYAQALEKHLWFHENALTYQPSLYGVRLSFALADWMHLASVYPPARAALESVRDRKTTALEGGSTDRDLFHDIASINDVLQEPARTHRLFAAIAARDRAFAAHCFGIALPAIVQAGDFALARGFIADPEKYVLRHAAHVNEQVPCWTQRDPQHEALHRKSCIRIYADDIDRLLAVLRGNGERAEADRLRALAVDSISDAGLRAEVDAALGP